MTAFIAKLIAKPESAKALEELQTELRELTHAQEPDCYVYELFRAVEEPHTYYCIASFKDQAAFDHHMSIDFHDRLVPPILESLASEMELTMCEAIGAGKSLST